jgi:hypothetical protein
MVFVMLSKTFERNQKKKEKQTNKTIIDKKQDAAPICSYGYLASLVRMMS